MGEEEYSKQGRDRRRIGEILQSENPKITDEHIEEALENKGPKERLGEALIRNKRADYEEVARALALQLGYPYLALIAQDVERESLDLFPHAFQMQRKFLVLRHDDRRIWVAMSDPKATNTVLDIETQTRRSPRIWVVSTDRLTRVQEQLLQGPTPSRYRLKLKEVLLHGKLGPKGKAPETMAFQVHDVTLYGIQLGMPAFPPRFIETLSNHRRDLNLYLRLNDKTEVNIEAMLIWNRYYQDQMRLGLEFHTRSQEEARLLYGSLVPHGRHDLSKAPKAKKDEDD